MNVKEYVGIDSFFKKPNGEEVSHSEMYAEIVNAIGLDTCAMYLPASKEKIKEALKEDKNLNNIPLHMWDARHPLFKREFMAIGIDYVSVSDTVCTLKQCAKMYANS